MNIQNVGAFKSAREVRIAHRRTMGSASIQPFNIPIDELRRLVAEMVD